MIPTNLVLLALLAIVLVGVAHFLPNGWKQKFVLGTGVLSSVVGIGLILAPSVTLDKELVTIQIEHGKLQLKHLSEDQEQERSIQEKEKESLESQIDLANAHKDLLELQIRLENARLEVLEAHQSGNQDELADARNEVAEVEKQIEVQEEKVQDAQSKLDELSVSSPVIKDCSNATGVFTPIHPKPGQTVRNSTYFRWSYSGEVPDSCKFEVRVNGNGIHDAARDEVKRIGETIYSLEIGDLKSAPSVMNSGKYSWSVNLVEFSPDYKDIAVRSQPFTFLYDDGANASNQDRNDTSSTEESAEATVNTDTTSATNDAGISSSSETETTPDANDTSTSAPSESEDTSATNDAGTSSSSETETTPDANDTSTSAPSESDVTPDANDADASGT